MPSTKNQTGGGQAPPNYHPDETKMETDILPTHDDRMALPPRRRAPLIEALNAMEEEKRVPVKALRERLTRAEFTLTTL